MDPHKTKSTINLRNFRKVHVIYKNHPVGLLPLSKNRKVDAQRPVPGTFTLLNTEKISPTSNRNRKDYKLDSNFGCFHETSE